MLALHSYRKESLTTFELLFSQAVQLQAMEVGWENTDRVITNPHRVLLSPNEQPLQLAVTKQGLGAKVPGGNTSIQSGFNSVGLECQGHTCSR